ncbi:MAG: transporter substrate-binding domain-containing protein [Defluviicoccus sp.]|nr:transporter substrate-binding domain-containing protein [Defluviicoccus sp.]
MIWKLIGSAVASALVLIGGAAQAGPLEDRVAAGKPVRLGFANAAPWAHPGKDGEPLGFVNVITIAVLDKMGHGKVEPVLTDWSGLIPSLVAGRVDIITGGMYILKARCNNIDFSEPIGQFGNAFIVPKGNPKKLQTYEDIKKAGAVMVAPTGYVMVEEARKVGIAEARIMKVPGTTEVLAAVRSGRADIGAMTAVEANKIAADAGDVDATDTNALPKWTFNWVGIGFHRDDDKFRGAFNAAMKGYIGSGTMLDAVAQYDYVPANVPGDVATDWICANR